MSFDCQTAEVISQTAMLESQTAFWSKLRSAAKFKESELEASKKSKAAQSLLLIAHEASSRKGWAGL